MILSYYDLLEAWKRKRIRFEPDIDEDQIGHSSIDIRLGRCYYKFKDTATSFILKPGNAEFDPKDIYETKTIANGDPFIIKPNELYLASTYEKIILPGNLAANVQGKSTLARLGLQVHMTAPHIHPYFSSWIALELFNYGKCDIAIRPGVDTICQVIYYGISKRLGKEFSGLGTYTHQTTPLPKGPAKHEP